MNKSPNGFSIEAFGPSTNPTIAPIIVHAKSIIDDL